MSDASIPSSSEEPTKHSTPSNVIKHIYFDDEHDDIEESTSQKVIERPTPSTIRVDTSDLISRCKDMIPLLSDSNQNITDKNDNIQLEKDDDINLPDIDNDSSSEKSSKESGEASSTSESEKQIELVKKKRKKKKKKKQKKQKPNDDLKPDTVVNTTET